VHQGEPGSRAPRQRAYVAPDDGRDTAELPSTTWARLRHRHPWAERSSQVSPGGKSTIGERDNHPLRARRTDARPMACARPTPGAMWT